jgi:hypothetical protein
MNCTRCGSVRGPCLRETCELKSSEIAEQNRDMVTIRILRTEAVDLLSNLPLGRFPQTIVALAEVLPSVAAAPEDPNPIRCDGFHVLGQCIKPMGHTGPHRTERGNGWL